MTCAWTAPQIYQANNLTGRRINWHGISNARRLKLIGQKVWTIEISRGFGRYVSSILGVNIGSSERVVIEYLDCCYLRYFKTFRSVVCLCSIRTNCANDSKVRSRWSYNRGTSTKRTSTKRIELRNYS